MLYRESIRFVWDKIKPGLEEIWTRLSPEWRPEDIYAACVTDAAELWIDSEHDDGFLILQKQPLSFEAGFKLLVWVAYYKGGDGVSQYMAEIERLAVQNGCSTVEFWSPRRGMEKLVAPYGYTLKNVIYSKEL